MTWTDAQKIDYLLSQPWTLVPDKGDDGELLLRVRELPGAVGCGETPEEVERDFWESLRATLEAYLHFGDVIPKPPGVQRFAWEAPPRSENVFVYKPTPLTKLTKVSQKTVGFALVSEPERSDVAAVSARS